MKAVILAAGMGSRLGRPNPKPLTRLANGQSIMELQVGNLQQYVDYHDISVVVGFKMEMIMESFPDLTYIYNNDYDTTNTSKSVLRALRKLQGDDVVWLNGDVVFDHRVLHQVINCPRSCMAVNTASVGEEEVKYRTTPDGSIAAVSKTVSGALGEAVGINKVLAADLPVLVRCLEECADTDYFERAIELSISRGVRFDPVDVADLACTEIDFAADLERANAQLPHIPYT